MRQCRYRECQEEIVWMKCSDSEYRIPVDAESLTDEDVELISRGEDVSYRAFDHVSHFDTCQRIYKH